MGKWKNRKVKDEDKELSPEPTGNDIGIVTVEEPEAQPLPAGVEEETVVDEEYKIEVIKDYHGRVDPFFLTHKDQNYAYRFLRDEQKNLNLKTNNMLFQRGGWQLVGRDHAIKRLKISGKYISTDGLVRRGDLVLAFMPKKLFEEKEKQKLKEANEPISQVKRLIKHGDPTAGGIGTIHPSMKGFQTEAQLKGNFKEA